MKKTNEKKEIRSILLKDIAPEVRKVILRDKPELKADDKVDMDEVLDYRLKVIRAQLNKSDKRIKKNDDKILKSVHDNEFISPQLNNEQQPPSSFGQRAADVIAKFGGSWIFIFIFILILLTWITFNSIQLLTKHFDPYPFILLNLVLSCLAAIQAPIIMMSQNRQESHDRLQSEHDYQVNLKAEIEVRLLHEKMDYLLFNQMKQLEEIQQVQVDLLENLRDNISEMKQK